MYAAGIIHETSLACIEGGYKRFSKARTNLWRGKWDSLDHCRPSRWWQQCKGRGKSVGGGSSLFIAAFYKRFMSSRGRRLAEIMMTMTRVTLYFGNQKKIQFCWEKQMYLSWKKLLFCGILSASAKLCKLTDISYTTVILG